MVASEYEPNGTYTMGDYVIRQGYLYKCLAHIAGESWTPSHWEQVTLGDELEQLPARVTEAEEAAETYYHALADMIAADYTPNGEYAVGEYVIRQGYLYRCLAYIAGEAWTPAHWEQVSFADEIVGVPAALSNIKLEVSRLANELIPTAIPKDEVERIIDGYLA